MESSHFRGHMAGVIAWCACVCCAMRTGACGIWPAFYIISSGLSWAREDVSFVFRQDLAIAGILAALVCVAGAGVCVRSLRWRECRCLPQ